MTKPNKSLRTDTRGLTTVEYIIVLGLIAVAGIQAWQTFGGSLVREVGEADKQIERLY